MATLHTARPDIATMVPSRSMEVAGAKRIDSPAVSRTNANTMERSSPISRIRRVVASPAKAKHSTGIVGSSAATSGP